MDEHKFTQTPLPESGRQSAVSDILAGKRSLAAEHIRKLSARFLIGPAVFF